MCVLACFRIHLNCGNELHNLWCVQLISEIGIERAKLICDWQAHKTFSAVSIRRRDNLHE